MVFKTKVFILFLLFTLTFSTKTFALEKIPAIISGNGTLNIAWQTSLEKLTNDGITFSQLAFDRRKQLYVYDRKDFSTFYYGDIKLHSSKYYFWKNQFAAVKSYFENENNNTFHKIYNTLISQFGQPQKTTIADDKEEQTFYWQTENTGIKVTYKPKEELGEIYIYSIELNLQYTDFIRNMPGEIPTYPNEPVGFASFSWETPLNEVIYNNQSLVPNKKANIFGEYIFAKYNKNFLDNNVKYITYDFFDGKLSSAYVYYKSVDNNNISEQMVKTYGLPATGHYNQTNNYYIYCWQGTKTNIFLVHNLHEKDSYIVYTSTKLQDNYTID